MATSKSQHQKFKFHIYTTKYPFLIIKIYGYKIPQRKHIKLHKYNKIKPNKNEETKLFIVKIMRENVKANGKENNKKRHKEARMFLYNSKFSLFC